MVRRAVNLPSRVLILGATSGIAMAVARRLAGPRAHFMLVARNSRKLTAVAQDLLTRGAAAVDTWVLDLDETDAHPEMLAAAAERLGGIDLALIAHGVLGDQAAAEEDFEAAAAILYTNLFSTVSLCTWLANYFQLEGHGSLAVLSSVAGDRGRKSNYVYGASKGALNVFLEGLRNRVDREGVQVLTIKPGFVATPMTAGIPQNALFASPDQIARGIVRAVVRRKDVVYLPWYWSAVMLAIRLIPGRIFKKMNL